MILLETDQSEVPVLTTESKHEARDTQQLQVNESVIDIICSHKSYIFSFCCLVAFLVCFVLIVIGKFLLYIFVKYLKCKLIFSYRVLFVT